MSHDDIRAALEAATPRPWDEEWRTIPDQIYYEVSDQGGVRSWRAQTRKVGANPRAESPHPLVLRNSQRDGRGYQTVSLPDATGRYVTKTVHSLVLAAFVGPRPDGLEIAHLNGDPSDNRLANLKYVTHQENESHKVAHGTRATGEDVNGARLLGWQVAEIRYLATQGVTQAKIAALFDLHSSHVSNIITGRIWPETLKRDTASPTWLAELLAENERLRDSIQHCADTLALHECERPEIERLTDENDRLRLADDYKPEGVDIVMAKLRDYRRRAEAAEQAIQRVRDMPATPPSGGYYMVSMRDVLRALDGGER